MFWVQGFWVQRSEVRYQMSENREPQNIEGKENFSISASGGFDIRYSK
jgi:hypothetical protein